VRDSIAQAFEIKVIGLKGTAGGTLGNPRVAPLVRLLQGPGARDARY